MIVRAADAADLRWICERTGCVLTPNARGISAVDTAGRTRGVIAYDCWTVNSVQAHMAVDSPVVWRSLLFPTFEYPFEEADRGLMIGIIPANNAKSIRLTHRLGFTETHRIRDGWSTGVDLVVFELRRENCRWLSAKRKVA